MPIPFFPLANGLLTGKHRRGAIVPGTRVENTTVDDETFDRIERLETFATNHGHSLLELAVGALTARPEIASVIAGATGAEQVRANVAAASTQLDAVELTELATL